jgi:bifunctional UDP-N-acetylglucosamine pyrophosphorylase/glucosamine-1-phosphate N-acetyltransferase
MTTPDFAIAIMAAGKGTRLKSKRPKVFHEIGGRALLLHVIAAASLKHTRAENLLLGC